MILIIAEKPSLARNIVAGIGNMKKYNGYYEGCGYIVTWAYGHLFSLCDIEDYLEDKNPKWRLSNIPCFPENFKFKLKNNDTGIQKQFNLIKTLCNREETQTIVNAGDADREGEIIIRLCVSNALQKEKPFYRLWLPDQTPETVKKALTEMKEEKYYNNLASEGYARTYIDWLYGVNLTRYATLKTGTLLRVGRVIVPIVKAIYDRDMQIKNFEPSIYYGITSKEETSGEIIELNSKEKFEKNEKNKAIELCNKYNKLEAIVKERKQKKDILNPGKLYSLSKLQNVLGKKYKMSMDKSLSIIQKLYEEGYLTYPRTNSEYLATAEMDKFKQIIKNINQMGYPIEFKNKKTIFDDSKIESHSALTPTYKIPKKGALTGDDLTVYLTVFKRFVAVFCSKEAIINKCEIKVELGEEETFTLKGSVIIEKGWTQYDDYGTKDKILPNLNKGDKININFKEIEKTTTPPKHYTIETLNNYLKNPFKDEKNNQEDDTEDYKAIFEGLELGTEATRTGIIDNAKKSEYIELKKDTYYILPKGEYLIESLKTMNISMDKYKTSELGKALKKVYHEEIKIKDAVDLAKKEIEAVFETKDNEESNGFYGDIVGKCPLCGNEVIKNRYGFGCKNFEKCSFKINGIICKKIISLKNAKLLLENGKTNKIEGFISKNGKKFDAYLKLDQDKKIIFEF